MAQDEVVAPAPKKMWFTPLPNRDSPWHGGAVLNVLTQGNDHLKIGISLNGLLNLQLAAAKVTAVVLAHSLPPPKVEPVNPITETEIQRFLMQLDTTPEEGNTNE